jgi:hypothetical protein
MRKVGIVTFIYILIFLINPMFALEKRWIPFCFDEKSINLHEPMNFMTRWDSLNMSYVGSWPFGSSNLAVACDTINDLLFCASGAGVYILDTNLANLSERIHCLGLTYGLSCEEEKLVVTSGAAGFDIWDYSNISQPVLLGRFHDPWYDVFRGVAIRQGYAYFGCDNWFRIFDISDPSAPQELGVYNIPGTFARSVGLKDNFALIANTQGGLQIIDISSPTTPTFVDSCLFSGGYAYDVAIKGNYAFVVVSYGDHGLNVVDITDIYNPHVVARLTFPYNVISSVSISGNLACVGTRYSSNEFYVVDITNPLNPTILGSANLSYVVPDGRAVVAVDSNAYVQVEQSTLYQANLSRIDISNPSSPVIDSLYSLPGYALRVCISNDYAYLANDKGGLRIIDISNPINPYEVGTCIVSDCKETKVQGNYAYVANGELYIFDITDPASPEQVGFSSTTGATWSIDVKNDFAYLGDYYGQGLSIVDISDPTNPFQVIFVETGDGSTFDVQVVDTLIYLAENDGIRIFNISDPTNPQSVGFGEWGCVAIDVYGRFAYITNGDPGQIGIIRVSDPANLELMAIYEANEGIKELAVIDTFLFAACNARIRMLNVADSLNPQLVGYQKTPGYNYDVAIANEYIYVPTLNLGLFVYTSPFLTSIKEYSKPVKSNKRNTLRIVSNPAKKTAQFEILGPQMKQSTILIYNLTGRIIKRFSPSSSKIVWDGSDDTGRKVSPGLYFVYLKANDYTETKKLIFLQ